jgi:endothelin-converting enzyme/putative endopeptidase
MRRAPGAKRPSAGPIAGIALLAGGFLLAACVVTRPEPGSGAPGEDRLTPEEVAQSVLQVMDRSVDPCVDFYQFACGGWLRETKLPPDRPRLGRGFAAVDEKNQEVLRDILEQLAAAKAGDRDGRRLGDFYASCSDEAESERIGTAPLRPIFDDIDTVRDPASLMAVVGRLHAIGIEALFSTAVDADFKDPQTAIAHWSQGGLGLPERGYYLKDDAQSRALRDAYVTHVAKMLRLAGEDEAAAQKEAPAILDLETRLARVSLDPADRRDPEKIYHRLDRPGLEKLTPNLPWAGYFEAIGYPAMQAINVGMPDFFTTLSSLVPGVDQATLRAYLRWQVLHQTAGALPRAFAEEDFQFFGKTLGGQKEIQPRWKRCVTATDEAIGEGLGRRFVERRFAGDSKTTALEMIRGIETALERAFTDLDWMDDPTRAAAREKLHAVTNTIGHPGVWRDYSRLVVRRGDDFGNRLAAARFEFRRQRDKVGGPMDRNDWEMTPPTVNAYYNPFLNEMVFPAGILQPPFFHRDFPRVMNYGAIGMGMGHELTHGFDDQGRKFDAHGRLREWWDPAVASRFEERARCVADLFDSYEVEPGLHLNGKQTLGEDIADLGGLKEAYRAYKAWEGAQAKPPASPVPGLDNDQLFFVAFAQPWCELITPEYARLLAQADDHAADRYRVLAAVSQFPDFARVFACTAGAPMNPEKRCQVW